MAGQDWSRNLLSRRCSGPTSQGEGDVGLEERTLSERARLSERINMDTTVNVETRLVIRPPYLVGKLRDLLDECDKAGISDDHILYVNSLLMPMMYVVKGDERSFGTALCPVAQAEGDGLVSLCEREAGHPDDKGHRFSEDSADWVHADEVDQARPGARVEF